MCRVTKTMFGHELPLRLSGYDHGRCGWPRIFFGGWAFVSRPVNGIFCLEGEWNRDLRNRGSVLPTLENLERLGYATFVHRDVATREELRYYCQKLVNTEARYRRFHVLYLAMHGAKNCLYLNDESKEEPIDLAELANLIGSAAQGRAVYLGSCSTLKAPRKQLDDFLAATGARLLCGYGKDVDWLEAASFEALLLQQLANDGHRDAAERYLSRAYLAPFAAALDVRFHYPPR